MTGAVQSVLALHLFIVFLTQLAKICLGRCCADHVLTQLAKIDHWWY
jgi:hypothetical protein